MQITISPKYAHDNQTANSYCAVSHKHNHAAYPKTWQTPYFLRLLALLYLFLGWQTGFAEEATESQLSPTAVEIVAVINSKQHPFLQSANFANRSDDLDALYQLGGYQLIWLANGNSEKNIQDLLTLLASADANGLNAANYDVQSLQQKLPNVLASGNINEQVNYDTALSISLLRFLHDLHYGRVNPQGINFNLKLREKRLLDLPALIKSGIDQASIPQLPSLVEPKLKQYQRLKTILADYRQIARQVPSVQFAFDHSVRPGESIAQAQDLKRFFMATGDLEQAPSNDKSTGNRYADKLVAAMKKFQHRHGLAGDGVIGKSTVVELNTPISQRVSQIEMAMERLRWLPELSSEPSIIVNIPAFQLWTFDNINALQPTVGNMRVVVGKALKNQTPILMADMSYIDFMPYWNVPYNIVKGEIIPKLLQNPGFLDKENMELVSNTGVTSFSASTISQLKQGSVRVRQRPGHKNALGKVKFLFPNKDDVYLHDTPSGSLFSRSRRDFSHGCVRVADPEKLAEFALKNQKGWDEEKIKAAMASEKMQRVILKKPIPVLFFYVTAFFDQDNQLIFYPDIYGHDVVLAEALKNPEDLADHNLFATPEPTPAPVISQSEEPKTLEASK